MLSRLTGDPHSLLRLVLFSVSLLDFTHILHLFMFADQLENTNSKTHTQHFFFFNHVTVSLSIVIPVQLQCYDTVTCPNTLSLILFRFCTCSTLTHYLRSHLKVCRYWPWLWPCVQDQAKEEGGIFSTYFSRYTVTWDIFPVCEARAVPIGCHIWSVLVFFHPGF